MRVLRRSLDALIQEATANPPRHFPHHPILHPTIPHFGEACANCGIAVEAHWQEMPGHFGNCGKFVRCDPPRMA